MKMDVLDILREAAAKKCPSIKVNIVEPPTYVSVFYSPEEVPSEVIFIYKKVCNVLSDDGKSNEGEKTPASADLDEFDLTGNPLETNFEDIDDNISILVEKQQRKMWLNSEECHLPISLNDARSIMNDFSLQRNRNRTLKRPLDVWALTKPNSGAESELNVKKKRHDVLLGLRFSKAVQDGKLSYFARSVVTFEKVCRMGSPDMVEPGAMMKEHLKLCGANMNKVKSKVRAVYHLSGSVRLEVKWEQPKLQPPLHEAMSVMVFEVVLGESDSSVHSLWKQVWLLEKLLEMFATSAKEIKGIDKVPTYDGSTHLFLDFESPKCRGASVLEQLKKLFSGGFSSEINDLSNSGIARRMTIYKVQETSKEGKLKRSIEQVLSNKKMNADDTDDLWEILSGSDSINELSNAFDTIYREVKQGQWKPFIRHTNKSRTSNLIRALCDSDYNNATDLTLFEKSEGHFALESLFVLGLEKLAHDYSYIFMESEFASRDELLSPPFPRKGLGVSQETWLSGCKEYLAWVKKMHASLEVVLLAEQSLAEHSPTGFQQALSSVASQALQHFQTPDNLPTYVTFKAAINSHQIDKLLSKPFDLWQLTLTSESPTRFVESVFLRSSLPIFPPRILTGDSDAYVVDNDKSSYTNCRFVTLMNKM